MLKESLASDFCEFKISFKPDIYLQQNSEPRTNLDNLIFNNCYPSWMQPWLSVLLICSFISDIDVAAYRVRAPADEDGSNHLDWSEHKLTKQDQVSIQIFRDTLLTKIISVTVLVYYWLSHGFHVPPYS